MIHSQCHCWVNTEKTGLIWFEFEMQFQLKIFDCILWWRNSGLIITLESLNHKSKVWKIEQAHKRCSQKGRLRRTVLKINIPLLIPSRGSVLIPFLGKYIKSSFYPPNLSTYNCENLFCNKIKFFALKSSSYVFAKKSSFQALV